MPESSQWTTGEGDHTRHRAEWIVNWILVNGGEARYIPAGRLALATGQNPLIAVRTADGWVYAKPGDTIEMGEGNIVEYDRELTIRVFRVASTEGATE